MPLASRFARFRNAEARRFVLFLAVGGVNTLVGYGLFAGLVLLGLPGTTAVIAATVLGVAFNYLSTGGVVFRHRTAGRLPRFVAVYVVQTALNVAGLRALEAAGLSPLVGGAAMLPPLAVFSYLAMRRFVFGRASAGAGATSSSIAA